MPTPIPYFKYPFCVDGTNSVDITPISPTGSDSGTVNYQYGFTPNYEYASTNPSNLPVPRQQFNQLMFDITSAIQQLQTQGAPLWVASGSGGPANYPIYAIVAYNAGSGIQIWMSNVSSNTSVPGADDNWSIISGNAQGVQTGTIIDFGGVTPPSGYVATDGTAYSRTIYSNLMAVLTQIQSCTTTASSYAVTVANSQYMYVGLPIEGSGIPADTTIASIIDSTHITISNMATASATVDITFFNWGAGDGSTTFNVPLLNTYATAGAGTPGLVPAGSVTGQKGGVAARQILPAELAPHTHPDSTVTVQYFTTLNGTIGSPREYVVLTGAGGSSTLPLVIGPYPPSTGAQSAMTLVQPTAIVTKCIKI